MKRKPRPFIGILFQCCHIYMRVYLNRAGTSYVGFCPKCSAKVQVKVVPGGSRARFWYAE